MRNVSYGQEGKPSILDIFGRYLSNKRVRKICKGHQGCLLDAGCGFYGALTRNEWNQFERILLADIDVSETLINFSSEKSIIEIIRGDINVSLRDVKNNSVDVIIANNLIEHLENPKLLLDEFYRVLSITGTMYINVPSWLGKFFLEFAAFKLNLASKLEMEDHKTYYSSRELWSLVRRSGFKPSTMTVKRTKFLLNTTLVVKQKI
jgi:SAM-dependent methyltransferase